jgi:hypothetical protein
MTLARILGLIAGVLAWTAALIGYLDDHRVRFGLIAAGVFFAVMPFAAGKKPKEPPNTGG